MSADWAGAWGQIAGAVGTFIAVAVALWIAIRETTARRREGDEHARAQARLVVVERPDVVNVNRDIEPDSIHHDLRFTIANYGDRPVLGIRVEVWLSEPVERSFNRSERVVLRDQQVELDVRVHGKVGKSVVSAWGVAWTDADGRRWVVDCPGGEARRLRTEEAARPLPKPWRLPPK